MSLWTRHPDRMHIAYMLIVRLRIVKLTSILSWGVWTAPELSFEKKQLRPSLQQLLTSPSLAQLSPIIPLIPIQWCYSAGFLAESGPTSDKTNCLLNSPYRAKACPRGSDVVAQHMLTLRCWMFYASCNSGCWHALLVSCAVRDRSRSNRMRELAWLSLAQELYKYGIGGIR